MMIKTKNFTYSVLHKIFLFADILFIFFHSDRQGQGHENLGLDE